MSGRRTNLALFGLVVLAVVSGFVAFGVGTPSGGWLVVAHGLLGLGIIVLFPWKVVVARRGLSRRVGGRWLSIVLSVLVVVTIASGVIQVTGSTDRLGPFTTMQVHVGGGVAALALTLAHVVQRPVRPRVADLSRRNALRTAGLLSAGALVYAGTETLWAIVGSRGSTRRFTGSHPVEAPAPVPPTQWLDDEVQHLGPGHVVKLLGVDIGVPRIDAQGDVVEAVLDCTGGWYARRRWSGARLDGLLPDRTRGESIVVRSVTGYWRRFPLSQASRLWLATRLEDRPLTAGNGAPVRLVVPGRRGYWWVKWVESVEVDDLPPWWQPPLPTA